MNPSNRSIRLWLAAAVLIETACSAGAIRLLGSDSESTPAPLAYCSESAGAFCLVTFGLEPPEKSLIEILSVDSIDDDLRLLIRHLDERHEFLCLPADDDRTLFYCSGPQLSLGSAVRIEVYAVSDGKLLATGEFRITAFALPTSVTGGPTLPPPLLFLTARATRTLAVGAAYPNPRRTATPTPTGTLTATATPRP